MLEMIGRRRIKSEETKRKISNANKGKGLGRVPWNKGKKLSYITGKRETYRRNKKENERSGEATLGTSSKEIKI
jgi:hypothetical protein